MSLNVFMMVDRIYSPRLGLRPKDMNHTVQIRIYLFGVFIILLWILDKWYCSDRFGILSLLTGSRVKSSWTGSHLKKCEKIQHVSKIEAIQFKFKMKYLDWQFLCTHTRTHNKVGWLPLGRRGWFFFSGVEICSQPLWSISGQKYFTLWGSNCLDMQNNRSLHVQYKLQKKKKKIIISQPYIKVNGVGWICFRCLSSEIH